LKEDEKKVEQLLTRLEAALQEQMLGTLCAAGSVAAGEITSEFENRAKVS